VKGNKTNEPVNFCTVYALKELTMFSGSLDWGWVGTEHRIFGVRKAIKLMFLTRGVVQFSTFTGL